MESQRELLYVLGGLGLKDNPDLKLHITVLKKLGLKNLLGWMTNAKAKDNLFFLHILGELFVLTVGVLLTVR